MDLWVDIVLEEHTASIFSPEDGGSMFLWNVGVYPQGHTMHNSEYQHRQKNYYTFRA
jgi:hypothetical protein